DEGAKRLYPAVRRTTCQAELLSGFYLLRDEPPELRTEPDPALYQSDRFGFVHPDDRGIESEGWRRRIHNDKFKRGIQNAVCKRKAAHHTKHVQEVPDGQPARQHRSRVPPHHEFGGTEAPARGTRRGTWSRASSVLRAGSYPGRTSERAQALLRIPTGARNPAVAS